MIAQDVAHMVEIERALIGSLLIDGEAIGKIAGIVQPDDLSGPTLRGIYAAMLGLTERGIRVDIVTTLSECRRRRVGVADYALTALVNYCPTSLHAESYAQLVAEDAERRREQDRRERGFRGAVQV